MNESEWSSDERRALYHLETWARWMRQGVGRGLGHRSHCSDGAHTLAQPDFEEMADSADMRAAQICDAVIRDLAPIERAAVHNRYKIAVWRFPRDNYESILSRAIMNIGKGLHARGVVHP